MFQLLRFFTKAVVGATATCTVSAWSTSPASLGDRASFRPLIAPIIISNWQDRSDSNIILSSSGPGLYMVSVLSVCVKYYGYKQGNYLHSNYEFPLHF